MDVDFISAVIFNFYRHLDGTFTLFGGKLNGSGLTYLNRVTHICVSKLTIIGSDNGLASARRRWNIVFTSIGPLGTNSSEILIEIRTFWLKKIHFNENVVRSFCLCLNKLMQAYRLYEYKQCINMKLAGWLLENTLSPSWKRLRDFLWSFFKIKTVTGEDLWQQYLKNMSDTLVVGNLVWG